MIPLLVVAAAAVVMFRLLGGTAQFRRSLPSEQDSKIEELTEYAGNLRASGKYNAAEKVYLQILKLNHRHYPTYSRLGTLYSAQRNFSDAIQCFDMATKLNPGASSFYNLGLAYFENKNTMKAIAMLEKSIMYEPAVPRYIALAKAFSKIGNTKKMLSALEQAAAFDSSPRVLWLLADAYSGAGRTEELQATYARIREADPDDKRLKTLERTPTGSVSSRRTRA